MQFKTLLTVKEFRTHFIKNVSPEYASGVHTTAEGLWISGKATNTAFRMQITKPAASSLLAPQVFGKITATDAGCDLKGKVRRPTAAYTALVISTALAALVTVPLGFMAVYSLQAAWYKDPQWWTTGIVFALLTLAAVAGMVISLFILLHIPKKKKERLLAELRRIIGEENILAEE